MVKSRVHDLAAEFGCSSGTAHGHAARDEHLRPESPVRSRAGPGVCRARPVGARKAQSRRGASTEAEPSQGRRGAAAATRVPTRKPVRRRRTAAEVAEHEAKAAAEAEEEAAKAPFDLEPLTLDAPSSEPVKPALSIEERARLLFKDVPPAPAEPVAETSERTEERGRRRRSGFARRASADSAALHAVVGPAQHASDRRAGRPVASVHSAARAAPGAVSAVRSGAGRVPGAPAVPVVRDRARCSRRALPRRRAVAARRRRADRRFASSVPTRSPVAGARRARRARRVLSIRTRCRRTS